MRYWKFSNPDSVQSCSNDGHEPLEAIEITKKGFDNYIASLPALPKITPRDPLKELDTLKAKLVSLGIQV